MLSEMAPRKGETYLPTPLNTTCVYTHELNQNTLNHFDGLFYLHSNCSCHNNQIKPKNNLTWRFCFLNRQQKLRFISVAYTAGRLDFISGSFSLATALCVCWHPSRLWRGQRSTHLQHFVRVCFESINR